MNKVFGSISYNVYREYDGGYSSQELVPRELETFPGGEVRVKLANKDFLHAPADVTRVVIKANLINSATVQALLHTNNAIRIKYPNAVIHAIIPYVPYARQDRICDDGESLGIQVMFDQINMCNFKTVTICDPHSVATPAGIRNCIVISQEDIFKGIYSVEHWKTVYIVAPDLGATKRAESFAKAVGAKGIIQFNKKRDLATGKILSFEMFADPDEVLNSNCLILDDIGDGMGTFIPISDKLWIHGVKWLDLAVTHGIFSKGFEFTHKFDKVYTSDSFYTDLNDRIHNLVQIPVKYAE